jgi:mono/diheme cytochrome c family protein
MTDFALRAGLAALTMTVAAPALAVLLAGSPEEGAPIHAERCVGCHTANFGGDGSSVYTRDPRRVNTIEGLMGQVERCNQMTGANLDSDQIDDLVAYLNATYYHFGE